jgi:Fe-S-cluster containining protein
MSENLTTPESIIRDYPRLTFDDRFCFQCDRTMECFTRCCHDVTIVLTPYDVLRMKQALQMESSEFLETYTLSPFAKDQKIPAIILKMDPETKNCPFVTEKGCSIYSDRPWACRMYPLGLAEPDKPTPKERGFHFLLREDLCKGHNTERTVKVSEWILEQGIEEYDAMGTPFKELMLHSFWNGEGFLSPEQVDMYYMGCYDLDRFRRFLFQTRFFELFDVDEDRIEAIRKDDLELLDFAMQWLKFSLFHENCMRIKRSVLESKRETVMQAGQGIHE